MEKTFCSAQIHHKHSHKHKHTHTHTHTHTYMLIPHLLTLPQTSAAFDEGGARGLLLNHLTVQSSCELVFDSQDVIDADQDAAQNAPLIDVSDLIGSFVTWRILFFF